MGTGLGALIATRDITAHEIFVPMGTEAGALIATRDITRIDIFVSVGTEAGAPPIELQPVSAQPDDDRTWPAVSIRATRSVH